MAIAPHVVKNIYKALSVQELEEKWKVIENKLMNKELFICNFVNEFMNASYDVNEDAMTQAISELLKEKTGKDYFIDSRVSYELFCDYEYRKEQAKKLGIEVNKDEKYIIKFNDIYEYVIDKLKGEISWIEEFKMFFNKLDFVSEDEKLEFLLLIFNDKEDLYLLGNELIKDYDSKKLYEDYMIKCEKFYNSNCLIG